jgi:hypothetical protein
MSYKMPFMFRRDTRCTTENGLVANDRNGKFRIVYVVMLALCWDMKHYNSSWMDNPNLPRHCTDDDYCLVPDIDLTDYENIYVFNLDNPEEAEIQAIYKMKELWANV